ncbi:MAG: hypothetical protein ACT4PZ_22315, partial [Panacagrimonas sp.]
MRLITNDRYLTLIREALETTILPELQSPAARAAGGIVQAAVVELLKRERRTSLLDDEIAAGEALAEELRQRVQQPGVGRP